MNTRWLKFSVTFYGPDGGGVRPIRAADKKAARACFYRLHPGTQIQTIRKTK